MNIFGKVLSLVNLECIFLTWYKIFIEFINMNTFPKRFENNPINRKTYSFFTVDGGFITDIKIKKTSKNVMRK